MITLQTRFADIFAYAVKYETPEHAEIVKGVLQRYHSALLQSISDGTVGTHSSPEFIQ